MQGSRGVLFNPSKQGEHVNHIAIGAVRALFELTLAEIEFPTIEYRQCYIGQMPVAGEPVSV